MVIPLKFQFSCEALSLNRKTVFEQHGFRAEIIHRQGEPDNTLRIMISCKDLTIELLPSKGLSVGEVFYQKQPVFWKPPAGLPDPEPLDLISGEIMINRKTMKGFTYLKTFMAGIEFYGLRNWGMPRVDKHTGEIHPLHGETSNIPVKMVACSCYQNHMETKTKFLYNKFIYNSDEPWYVSGEPMFEITRIVTIPAENHSFKVIDSIKNITDDILVPDWGYHITFRPEKGSKLIVPSKKVEERSGGKIPNDVETWYPAKKQEVRTETGIIHKSLKLYEENDLKVNKVLMIYPSGRGITLSFPPSPYFQTWFCNGGANSTEFTYSATGKPVLAKNWDGQGIEFGSSPLDHDGNIDTSVDFKEILEPGETYEIELKLEMLTDSQVKTLYSDIQSFNQINRKN